MQIDHADRIPSRRTEVLQTYASSEYPKKEIDIEIELRLGSTRIGFNLTETKQQNPNTGARANNTLHK